jgi:hypothetical protein
MLMVLGRAWLNTGRVEARCFGFVVVAMEVRQLFASVFVEFGAHVCVECGVF